MTGPLAQQIAQVREALTYWGDRAVESNGTARGRERIRGQFDASLAALSVIERHVQAREWERDELGPFFVRDIARLAGLPDDASMDAIHNAIRAALSARGEGGGS